MHETKFFGRIHFSQQFCRSCSQLLASIDINSYSNRKSIANRYDSFVRSIIYIIDPTFISSTKYRSHAIKEPFRHRPTFIAFYRLVQKTTVSTITTWYLLYTTIIEGRGCYSDFMKRLSCYSDFIRKKVRIATLH